MLDLVTYRDNGRTGWTGFTRHHMGCRKSSNHYRGY